jgi:hypothetical protein
MADPSSLLGPIDVFRPYAEYLVLVLVVVNMSTRLIAHRTHKRQAQDRPDAITRVMGHELSNVVLLLASFYYLSVHHHGGLVLSTLVVTLVIADFFEFEARKVEARSGGPLERPKSALVASMLVLGYALFQTLFFIVKPIWNGIV